MPSNSISRTMKFLSGLALVPIPAAIFTSGVVLTYGYASGLIFSIGDTRQLTPIFTGIIIGSIIFSLIGFLLKSSLQNLLSLTVLTVILLVASSVIIYLNSLVLNSTNAMIVSLLMGSPAMAISQLLRSRSEVFSRVARLVFGAVQGILIIVFIFVYAVIYELQGQVNLYLGPLIFLVVSLVYLTVTRMILSGSFTTFFPK
ncbi:MAG: hypothetical protein M1526_05680 [Candidatus Thermoplasmatota archaeon]|nr:hypothetical protein [Candidatus Thermoplasmatota archaeon]